MSRTIFFTDADPGDVVFVQNATTGINAVIRSIVKTFQPGDSILLLDIAYGKSGFLGRLRGGMSLSPKNFFFSP